MPGASDYHDADRSNYAYDDVDPNRGAQNMNPMTGDSSYAPSGVARDPTYGASYPANSSSPSGYDGRDYLSEAHLTGSTAANNSEHEQQQHHASFPPDSSYNGAPGEHDTESPRRAGEYDEGYDLVEDKGDLALLEETEPQPELDNYVEDVVQPGFDEAVLRALCDMDVRLFLYLLSRIQADIFAQVGVPLLLDRIKQSMTSCRVCAFI